MSYKNVNLKRTHHALKVLKDGFRKAEQAHEARSADNESFARELRAKYPEGNYSTAFYTSAILPKLKADTDAHNAKNRQQFIDTMGETPAEMLEAVRTLREGADFRTQALDFSDPTLINALKMIDAYGKEMPFEDQRNLCLTFAGDFPALKAIEAKMKKNGLSYHSIAHKMQKQIDGALLDEAESIIYSMFPEAGATFKGNQYREWYNREINETAEILGLDLSVDPYREAIKADAYHTGGNSEWYQEQKRQQEAHKLIREWENDLREMESQGDTEQANRSAKAMYNALAESGIKLREEP